MRFWIREIMGWLLVLAGLYGFVVCLGLLVSDRPQMIEAAIFTVPCIFVFRGGIHLLKVAIAARAAMQAESRIARPAAEKTPARKSDAHWDW
ncbi:MAG TPA: hypothetical protein VFE62_23240 [Gemmataceae bacterium]|nr:hypothetical protein [Gemmataceae bacterium]